MKKDEHVFLEHILESIKNILKEKNRNEKSLSSV